MSYLRQTHLRILNKNWVVMFKLADFLKKIITRIYSYWICSNLKSSGKNSFIKYPTYINYSDQIELGNNVVIYQDAWFDLSPVQNTGTLLKIGNNISIGRSFKVSVRERVDIEDDVLIADFVWISDYGHGHDDLEVPVIRQPHIEPSPVKIKSGSFIGIGARIFPGVTIGKNAVVGANTVVKKDVPDNYVAFGIPAKVIPKKGVFCDSMP